MGYGVQWGGAAMVDLDGDGSMELIVGANDYAHAYSAFGVIAYAHATGAWASGARSWPTSSTVGGAFDAMGHPQAPPAWWLGDPYPGP